MSFNIKSPRKKYMALYEAFFVIIPPEDEYSEETIMIKSIDLNRVEDFGPNGEDEDRTMVTMFSGKEYLLSCNHIDFGNYLMEEVDGFGKLLKFDLN